ncbi:hypothetical protein LTR28_005151 [Elasticomyces elasticus]|nr:hypothetical protein LTR28_005151 [Elasticomyces elasticus]
MLTSILSNNALYESVKAFVKEYMQRFDASHDFKHIERVVAMAHHILMRESAAIADFRHDSDAVYLAALLHDVGDHKYLRPGENTENQIAECLLERGASSDLAMKVQTIAENVSYSKEAKDPLTTQAILRQHPELAIVQDADRLDAIGAVGIARVFTYGGAKAADRGLEGSIQHFGEKLEKLEGMMKTGTGRIIAQERTQRLQLFKSWWDEENKLIE